MELQLPQILEEFEIMSFTSGAHYKIQILVDGKWTCSCPDWTNRRKKKGEDCKHIRTEKQKRGITLTS